LLEEWEGESKVMTIKKKNKRSKRNKIFMSCKAKRERK